MIEFYPSIKILHMSMAVISVVGFVLRFMWKVQGSPCLDHKLSRVLPHVIDSCLLLLGLALAVMLQLAPWAVPWLGMKLLLLLLYIGCGTLALKRARTARMRWLFFIAAVAIFAQMIGVALLHSPWGWLA